MKMPPIGQEDTNELTGAPHTPASGHAANAFAAASRGTRAAAPGQHHETPVSPPRTTRFPTVANPFTQHSGQPHKHAETGKDAAKDKQAGHDALPGYADAAADPTPAYQDGAPQPGDAKEKAFSWEREGGGQSSSGDSGSDSDDGSDDSPNYDDIPRYPDEFRSNIQGFPSSAAAQPKHNIDMSRLFEVAPAPADLTKDKWSNTHNQIFNFTTQVTEKLQAAADASIAHMPKAKNDAEKTNQYMQTAEGCMYLIMKKVAAFDGGMWNDINRKRWHRSVRAYQAKLYEKMVEEWQVTITSPGKMHFQSRQTMFSGTAASKATTDEWDALKKIIRDSGNTPPGKFTGQFGQ